MKEWKAATFGPHWKAFFSPRTANGLIQHHSYIGQGLFCRLIFEPGDYVPGFNCNSSIGNVRKYFRMLCADDQS
jgi:hypothetical protein